MYPLKTVSWLLVTFIVLTIPLHAGAQPAVPDVHAAPQTVITVNSGSDPDNSKSKTCASASPCTLRRAIVQAQSLTPAQRPVLIQFNIPALEAEGYDSDLAAWEIRPLASTDQSVFLALNGGQITIDGDTQPGGRSDGPKIMLHGPGTGNKVAFILGSSNTGVDDKNVIRGLGFKNFADHIVVNSHENEIEDNWFGLTADGQEAFLRNGDAHDGSGTSGVSLSANAADNEITENVFLGFYGFALEMRGEANTFENNSVGTNGAGNVPEKQTDPDLICTFRDWLGGGGIRIEGREHVVAGNTLAALRLAISATATQPDALRIMGEGHTIFNNQIGVDGSGKDTGVCGGGITFAGEPQDITVEANLIVDPVFSGISLNGALYDANELRGNIIRRQTPWPAENGEDAVQLGPSLPQALQDFKPARVIDIAGKQVSGISGAGSACPNCVIELFRDDEDGVTETLETVAVVTAAADGTWQAMLAKELSPNEGLRTTSTSAAFNTIAGLRAGTTTGLSDLYLPKVAQVITFPTPQDGTVGDEITLTASASSGLPVTYLSQTTAVCSVAGSQAALLQIGECRITAMQEGDETYAPARDVTAAFAVRGIAQEITFLPLAAGVVGEVVVLDATASSGLPVTYQSNSPAICSVTNSEVSLLAAGTCSITAMQAGDNHYAPAAPVTETFQVHLPGHHYKQRMPIILSK